MLPLMSDAWSWVVGGLLGVIMFTFIIIRCIRNGYLGDPRKDPRALWGWVIFVGAGLISIVGFLVHLLKVI